MALIRFLLLFLGCGVFAGDLLAQASPDSILVDLPDSIRSSAGDPILPGMSASSQWIWDSLTRVPPGSIVVGHSDRPIGELHEAEGKDALFYALLGMVLLLAVFRRLFPKYWKDLFRLFFRTTLRQRQLRDQLQLASLPSLALNAFFYLSLAFYLSLLLTRRGLDLAGGYWSLWAWLLIGLMLMYGVKWIGLQVSAWIFGQRELGEDYVFLVFTVNKMMGLFLLPSVIAMAFADGWVYALLFGVSLLLIGGLLLYRGYLTYRVVRRQAALSPFHYFLYWLGFEVAPLLVLHRFLLGFFPEMT
jgi:hypothetical protein